MPFETITCEEAKGVATLTLNRPEKLNALSLRMGDEICEALEALRRREELRVLLVTGAGRAFSAGGDLASMDEGKGDPFAIDRGVRVYCEAAQRLRELSVPVVAKVNGDAFGGSLGIIMACGLPLAREDARLGFAFTRVGLSGADAGVSYLLPRLVGVAKAAELLLLGEVVGAKEAERIGLVTRAVPAADLDRAAGEIVARLAPGPPLPPPATKR